MTRTLRGSSFAAVLLFSIAPLCAEESGMEKKLGLLDSRLPAKKSAPPATPAPHPNNATATTYRNPTDPNPVSPPTPPPARLTQPHTGPIQPYDRLARDNIHVTTSVLESGSAGMNRWNYYWHYYYRNRTVTQNKLIEVSLSAIGNRGGDVTIQCFGVIRSDGGSETVARCTDQDIISDGAGKWCFTLQAQRTEYQSSYYYNGYYYGNRRTRTSGEKIAGYFVRVIRDGRIVGFAASPSSYERFALDTSL